jgi:hypothetical protein
MRRRVPRCRNIRWRLRIAIRKGGNNMRFAKVVFVGGGIWGFAIVTPLYFLRHSLVPQHPSLATDPGFFYSFLAVTMAWQFAFLAIGFDPVRLHALMIPAMVEKFGYVLTIGFLWTRGQMPASEAFLAVPDFALGVLFVVALAKVRSSSVTLLPSRAVDA